MSRRLVTVPFALVTLATFGYFISLGSLLPTLPRYVEDELGGGGVAVGVAVGSFAFSAAVVRPLVGRLGDRRGRRLLIMGGSALAGLSMLGYALVDSLPALVALRLVTGLGEAGVFVGAATAVQDMAPEDRRGEAASYFSVALYAGLALGPALGEWILDAHGFDAVWLTAGAAALVAMVLGVGTPVIPPGKPQPFRILHPSAIGPGMVLFLGLLPFIGFAAFIALYGPEVSIDDTAPVFLLYAGLVLAIRVAGARLPDRLGWRRASSIGLVSTGVAGLLLAVWGASAGVWVATAFMSVGMALLFPALFAAMVTSVPLEERGQAVGTFSLFFDLASGIGPPLLGAVVALASYRWSFAVAGALALTGLAAVARLSRRPTTILAPEGP